MDQSALKRPPLLVFDRADERTSQSLRPCRRHRQQEEGRQEQALATHATHPFGLGAQPRIKGETTSVERQPNRSDLPVESRNIALSPCDQESRDVGRS